MSAQTSPVEPARYTPAAPSWSQDQAAALERSRRIAWLVAGAAAALAAVQAVALIVLIPLKRVTPYTVLVDRQTGFVQTTPGVTLASVSESDAVRQAFLAQYILARETFDLADYQENYRRTLLWSDQQAAAGYRRDWDRANPDGVQARYRATTRVRVIVKEARLLSPTTAVVRFETEQTEGAAAIQGLRQPWVATLAFSVAGRPLNEADRFLNPLGFRVTGYRRDAETPAPLPVAAPPLVQTPPAAAPPVEGAPAPAETMPPTVGQTATGAADDPGRPQ